MYLVDQLLGLDCYKFIIYHNFYIFRIRSLKFKNFLFHEANIPKYLTFSTFKI